MVQGIRKVQAKVMVVLTSIKVFLRRARTAQFLLPLATLLWPLWLNAPIVLADPGKPSVRQPASKVIPATPKIVAPLDGLTTKAGCLVDVIVVVPEDGNVSSVVVLGDDGNALGITNQSPFVVHWKTDGAHPGLHTLRAQVHYKDGSSLDATPIRVMIEAPTLVVLKESTSLILTNEERLVSGDTPEGSVVRFRVERDVLAPEGQVLVRAGATAYGKAVKSSGSGMFGRAGELNIGLESVEAFDGTSVPIRAVRNATADDSLGGVIVGALLLSWLFVFMSGSDIEIEPGTFFTAYVNRDTVISRPGPAPIASPLGASRSASLLFPTEGAHVPKESKIILSCVCTPADEAAFVRIYIDESNLLVAQKGNLNRIEWDTDRTERFSQSGKHTMSAEITFSTGHTLMTRPVTFSLDD